MIGIQRVSQLLTELAARRRPTLARSSARVQALNVCASISSQPAP